MKSYTHLAAGLATAGGAVVISTAITNNVSFWQTTEIMIAGAAASVLPDVDLEESEGRKFNLVLLIAMGIASAGTFIYRWIIDAPAVLYVFALLGMGGYLTLYLLGSFKTEHRGATHSVTFGLVMALFVLAITDLPLVALVYLLAFLSHIGLDLLNSMPLRLLYPLQIKTCIGLVKGEGLANTLILIGFIIINIGEFLFLIFK